MLKGEEISQLPYGFKTLDFYGLGNGKAISAKTLDTQTLARISKPELVRYQINGYINKMIDYAGDPRYKHLAAPERITSKELHLAIPANTSQIHMEQIQRCIQYGADNGVTVLVTKVK